MKEIRLLTQDDLEDVYRLFKEASQDRKNIYTWAIYDESNISEEYFTHLLDENNTIQYLFGVFHNGVLVGALTLFHPIIVGTKHKSIIENMYVKDIDHLDEQLLNSVVEFCQEMNIEKILAPVASNNIGAMVFYSEYGFSKAGFETNSRKYGDHYIDEHWLIYPIESVTSSHT
ncbi:GNAT family N-acetyltransferase [Staphylococcus carnosus]|uniref:Acetyltransferase n=2 Tax=Staphylococcus carnosus TaxID=1281 RepID=A0AAJ0NGJ8_STACA|nr:GNAT family N-acetyltransferase [Staphylococcus carnosus]ANZ33931.1 acetyltransferase [Staphylococcus carnosus]KKB24988.1 acetyltransferase [Staphylococcus carnosus]KOR14117.1 acetyltransferase [Staphylococcus carnosus]PNZ98679.1 GNAT family N-acetyltransferase [Staphylococcus carnosus]QPT03537.1 GNAT family N-acetyltransferase [Staphylococcus carnosus]